MEKARKASKFAAKNLCQMACGVMLAGLLSLLATGTARASKTVPAPATGDRLLSSWGTDSVAAFAAKAIPEAMARGKVPGAVFLVVRGDKVVFSKAYGLADVRNDQPVSLAGTLFRVASISKILTAAAVLDLVAEGRLDLHRNVNHYLSRFRIDPAFREPITLSNLLTHTSGFDVCQLDYAARTAAQKLSLRD